MAVATALSLPLSLAGSSIATAALLFRLLQAAKPAAMSFADNAPSWEVLSNMVKVTSCGSNSQHCYGLAD